MGATVRGSWVMLDGSRARHTMDRHGAGAARMAGQRPMTPAKLLSAHRSINNAQVINSGNPALSNEGRPIFRAVHKSKQTETHVVFDVRRRGLVVHTMYQHALDANGRRVRRRGGKKPPA
ncbi:MAG: hypothetical protein CVT77_06545 [Alphaproteobacteria bacterium HGW-Alphaproteobacteria-16]|nr:MAG: hypothetical protein CVT77_06545 [Alphaproteobacteria bacterium HGW-Alphaproteobacteria-16]